MKLSLALLVGLGAADYTCSSGWSFQTGHSYTYKVKSSVDAALAYNDGTHTPTQGLSGELELNFYDACNAAVTFKQRQGRHVQTLMAKTIFNDGLIQAVSFPESQKISENNLLKALLSSVQIDMDGAQYKGIITEKNTSFGPSASLYECNCDCGLGVNCDCEDECGELRITRQSQVNIDAEKSTLNPLVDRLMTKATFDFDMELDDSVCVYTHKTGIPSRIACEQTVTGTDGDQINAKLSLTATGSSSSSASVLPDKLVNCELRITATEQDELPCNGDAECLINLIPDVAQAKTHAVKSQYVLRKEIMSMDDNQLAALIEMASTIEMEDVKNADLLNYLFSEISACTTNACNAVLDIIPYPETYPAVYHAAMINPTEKAISNIMDDIQAAPSTEKIDLLADILVEYESDVFNRRADSMINAQCSFETSASSLTGYFRSTSGSLDEYELFTWLQMANSNGAMLDIDKLFNCASIESTKPIAEQAIFNLARQLPADYFAQRITPRSISQMSAMILGLFENNHSSHDIQQLFESVGMSSELLNILLTSLDQTHDQADRALWNKRMPIELPESLEQIQFLSGLTLISEAGSRNMAAIEVINRLVNGNGENVLEVDFLINDMYEIMKLSLDSGIIFTDEEWTSILETENALVAFIQAVINQKFDEMSNSPIFPHLKNFMRMGGVTVKLYGASVELGWIGQIMHNLEQFYSSLSPKYTMPQLDQLYGIFTEGIDHAYSNVLDSRSAVHVPLVNGMVLCRHRAQILTTNYKGNVLPDLINLGKSGKLQVAPSITVGNVIETSISGLEATATRVDLTDSHISFNIQAQYDVSDNIELKFLVSPTMTSPAHYQSQSFLTVDIPRELPYKVKTGSDLIGSDIVLVYGDTGYEMYLDNEIKGHFVLLKKSFIPNFKLKVASLGEVSLQSKGDSIQNGAIQLKAKTVSGVPYTTSYKQSCMDIDDCHVALLIDVPMFDRVVASLDMMIDEQNNDMSVSHNVKYGSQYVYRVKGAFDTDGQKTNGQLALNTNIATPIEVQIRCSDTLATGLISGINNERSESECRLRYNDATSRISLKKSDNVRYDFTVNTPVVTSQIMAGVNGDQVKGLFAVYRYPLGTFDQLEQMTIANLKPYQMVYTIYQQKQNRIQGKLDLRNNEIVAFKVFYADSENHEIKIRSKWMKLDLTCEVMMSNNQVQIHQALNADQKIAEQLTGLSFAYLSADGQIAIDHMIAHNIDDLSHCSGLIVEDSVTMFRLSAGQSAVCASFNGNGLNNHLEFNADSKLAPAMNYSPIAFRFDNQIEQSTAEMISTLTVGQVVDVEGRLAGAYSNENVNLQGNAAGAFYGKQFSYDGTVNGNLQMDGNQWSWAGGTVSFNANGLTGQYEVDATHSSEIVGSTDVEAVKLTTPSLENTLTVNYINAQDMLIPVGFVYESSQQQIRLLLLPTETFGTFNYVDQENEAALQLANNQLDTKLTTSVVNMQARVRIEPVTIQAQLISSPINVSIKHENGHTIKMKNSQIGHLDMSVSNDYIVTLNDLLVNVGTIETEHVGLVGQTTIRADRDGFKQCSINHDVRIMDATFHLTAALHMPSSEAVYFSESDDFKFCPQMSLQSYAVASFDDNNIGVWTTYNADLADFCLNSIRTEDRVIRQQIAFNVPVTHISIQNNMHDYEDMNAEYENWSTIICYGDNCVQGQLEKGVELAAKLPIVDTNVVLKGGLEDNTLTLNGQAKCMGDDYGIVSKHFLADDEYVSETTLTGKYDANQQIKINWDEPEFLFNHESRLGLIKLTGQVGSNTLETLISFDVLDNQLESDITVNWAQPAAEILAKGTLAGLDFDVKGDGNAKVAKVQIKAGDFNHQTTLLISDLDIVTITEYQQNSLKVVKEGRDGELEVIGNGYGSVQIKTNNGNKKNLITMDVTSFGNMINVVSDLDEDQHHIDLYLNNVVFDYKSGEYTSEGTLDSVEWELKGDITSSMKHNAELDLNIVDRSSPWNVVEIPVNIFYSLDIPAQSAQLTTSVSDIVNIQLAGHIEKELFVGTMSLTADGIDIENATIRAGKTKKSYIVDVDVSADNHMQVEYDPSLVTVEMRQNMAPYMRSVNAEWTPNTLLASIEAYNEWVGGASYNIEQMKFDASVTGPNDFFEFTHNESQSRLSAKWGEIVNLRSQYIHKQSFVLEGSVMDADIALNADMRTQLVRIEVISPLVLIQMTNTNTYELEQNMAPYTLQLLADVRGTVVMAYKNNKIAANWDDASSELAVNGAVMDVNGELYINWAQVKYDLVIDGIANSHLQKKDNLIEFTVEVNDIVKSIMHVDYESYKVSSKGEATDASWNFVLDYPAERATALLIIDDASYEIDVSTQEGTISLGNYGNAEYRFDTDMFTLKIASAVNVQLALDRNTFGTKLIVNMDETTFKMAHNGLDLTQLQVQLQQDSAVTFVLTIDLENGQIVVKEATTGLNVELNKQGNTYTGIVNCDAAGIQINVAKLEVIDYIPESIEMTADISEIINLDINAIRVENGFEATITSDQYFTLETHQEISLSPPCIDSRVDMDVMGMIKFNTMIQYEDENTSAGININSPIIKGVAQFEAEGWTITKLAIDNIMINTDTIPFTARGGAVYENGAFTMKQTRIQPRSGEYYIFGLTKPVTISSSGLEPVQTKIFIGKQQFILSFEDLFNMEFTNNHEQYNIHIIAQDGVYNVEMNLDAINVLSTTDMLQQDKQQELKVTNNGQNVIEFNLARTGDLYVVRMFNSETKKMQAQYQNGQYQLRAVYEGVLDTVMLQGDGFNSATGKIESGASSLVYNLNSRLSGSSIILMVQNEQIFQFDSESFEAFQVLLTLKGYSASYVHKNAFGQMVLDGNDIQVNADVDYAKQKLNVLVNQNRTVLLKSRIENANDQITFVAELNSKHMAKLAVIPSQYRVKYELRYNGDQYTSTGDFSLTTFNELSLIAPLGVIECNQQRCTAQADHGSYELKAIVEFNKALQLQLTGEDESNEVIMLALSKTQGKLVVKFFNIIDIVGMRQANQITLQGQIDNTNIDFNTNVGRDLSLVVQGANVDFDVKLDTDYAKWNMTKPSVNSFEYQDGVITLVGAKQRYVVSSVNGMIDIHRGGLTQKK